MDFISENPFGAKVDTCSGQIIIPARKQSNKDRLFAAAAEKAAATWKKPTLSSLPLTGYWAHMHGMSPTATLLLNRFQWRFQSGNIMRDGMRWCVDTSATWEMETGITASSWPAAVACAGKFIVKSAMKFNGEKATWLRPTEAFVALFGVTLEIYNVVGELENRRKRAGRPTAGTMPPTGTPLTIEEKACLDAWLAAGGQTTMKSSHLVNSK